MPSLYCTRAKYNPGLDVTVHPNYRPLKYVNYTTTIYRENGHWKLLSAHATESLRRTQTGATIFIDHYILGRVTILFKEFLCRS